MNKTNGFERRTEGKKQAIIDAARSLFFSQGPKQTTIAQIAKKAAVSQVSIYNYFKNKDELLEIVIAGHLEKSLARAEEILELDIPFSEKLICFFKLGNESKNEITDQSLSHIDWQDAKIQAIYAAFVMEKQLPFLLRFIEQGKQEGVIKKDLSTEAAMAYFSANMAIYRDKDLLKKGKEYIESLSHLFFYGLLGK